MSFVLSSAMFSAARTTNAVATAPSSSNKRNPRIFSSPPRASSRVAIGDLALLSIPREECLDDSTVGISEVVPHQNGPSCTYVESERWGSFHKRFGNKPRKGRRGLRSIFRRTSRQEGSPGADGLLSSDVKAMWECTDPPAESEEPDQWFDDAECEEPDQWFDEVPLQREDYLDNREKNGEWRLVDEASFD